MTTPLLLLHGFLGAPASFDDLRERLAWRRVSAPWLPGHGPTPAPDSFAAAIDALTPAEPSLVLGYSMGGRLALALAERRPDRVLGVLAIGAHFGLVDPVEREARRQTEARWAGQLREGGLPSFLSDWEAMPVFATQSDAQVASQRSVRLGHDARRVAQALEVLGSAAMPNVAPSARTALIVGERDEKFLALATAAHQQGRTLAVHVVPGAGHNLLVEAPGELARVCRTQLTQWLAPTQPMETRP